MQIYRVSWHFSWPALLWILVVLGLGACSENSLDRNHFSKQPMASNPSESSVLPEHFQSYEDFVQWVDEQDYVFMPNVLFIEEETAPHVVVDEKRVGLPVPRDTLDADVPTQGLFGEVTTLKTEGNFYAIGTIVVSLSEEYPFLRRISGKPVHVDGFDFYPTEPAGLHEVYYKAVSPSDAQTRTQQLVDEDGVDLMTSKQPLTTEQRAQLIEERCPKNSEEQTVDCSTTLGYNNNIEYNHRLNSDWRLHVTARPKLEVFALTKEDIVRIPGTVSQECYCGLLVDTMDQNLLSEELVKSTVATWEWQLEWKDSPQNAPSPFAGLSNRPDRVTMWNEDGELQPLNQWFAVSDGSGGFTPITANGPRDADLAQWVETFYTRGLKDHVFPTYGASMSATLSAGFDAYLAASTAAVPRPWTATQTLQIMFYVGDVFRAYVDQEWTTHGTGIFAVHAPDQNVSGCFGTSSLNLARIGYFGEPPEPTHDIRTWSNRRKLCQGLFTYCYGTPETHIRETVLRLEATLESFSVKAEYTHDLANLEDGFGIQNNTIWSMWPQNHVKTITFTIPSTPPIPVLLTVHSNLKAKLNADLKGSVEVKVEPRPAAGVIYTTTFGTRSGQQQVADEEAANYNDTEPLDQCSGDECANQFDTGFSFHGLNWDTNVELTGSVGVEAQLSFGPEIGIYLYDMAGPVFTPLSLYGGVKVNVTGTASSQDGGYTTGQAELKTGLKGSVTGQVKLPWCSVPESCGLSTGSWTFLDTCAGEPGTWLRDYLCLGGQTSLGPKMDTLVLRSHERLGSEGSCSLFRDYNYCVQAAYCEVDRIAVVRAGSSTFEYPTKVFMDDFDVDDLITEFDISQFTMTRDKCQGSQEWDGDDLDEACVSSWDGVPFFNDQMKVVFEKPFKEGDTIFIWRQSQETAQQTTCRATGFFDVYLETPDGSVSRRINEVLSPDNGVYNNWEMILRRNHIIH